MKGEDLRERLVAASLLLSDGELSLESENDLLLYICRIVRGRRGVAQLGGETFPIKRIVKMDSRATAVMREWARSPITSEADLRRRLGLTSGTAWRVVKRLAAVGVLVKSGRWWKLASHVARDVQHDGGEHSQIPAAEKLDGRAAELLREWKRNPLASVLDIRNRLGLSNGSSSRLLKKLALAEVLVKDGRWWKLADHVTEDAEAPPHDKSK